MKDHVNPTITIDENHTYFEKELAGTEELNFMLNFYYCDCHLIEQANGKQ